MRPVWLDARGPEKKGHKLGNLAGCKSCRDPSDPEKVIDNDGSHNNKLIL